MDFETALMFVKRGERITNENWNGRDMHIVRMRGFPDGVEANDETCDMHQLPAGSVVRVRPYIAMMDAQGMISPWTPSQQDLFSTGWQIKKDELECLDGRHC